MQLRLLGPVEAVDGGRPIPLGGRKPRALLAILTLHANEVVSSDRLIDELWGERPPATATTALQVYVSRLRKVLPAGALVTRSPGYALEIDPEDVDAYRFERLVAEARTAETHRARELLGEALELWRGSPLADLSFEPFAQAELARLEELYAVAVEDRIEADLALGRHAELVPELEALAARDPLRERLRGQLMLALYRSGRQADALEVFRSARRSLVDELGIEPGPALQRLEHAILAQDPSLEAPVAAEPPSARAVPERKLVTVLFIDLGLDGDASADPERARDRHARAGAAAFEEIESAGGTAEAGIAGAVLAVFGSPSALEDHAQRALAAALAVRDRVGSADMRAAAESGEVLADEDGGVVGAPVIAAARLVREAAPGEILVGPRAAAAARGRAELRDGRVLAGVSFAPRPAPAGFPSVFVGRSGELAQLAAAVGPSPRLVCVTGEAGVGKTSLLRELRAQLGAETTWLTGRCLPYGRATTYRPLGEIVRERLGDLPEREILGLTLGLDVAGDLHPRDARDRLHEAVVDFLGEVAAEGRLVVAIEDVHWAEEPLLDLLEQVVRDVAEPLLLLATARPELLEHASAWGRDATRVHLGPLSASETDDLLSRLAGELPADVRRAVAARAEGNPFFVEELLQAVAEGLTLPDSVHAVLAARIDRLPGPAKQALQAAAVIGRSFWERPLAELTGSGPELDLLERRDFVRRQPRSALEGEREYVFKHALTRDVAYGSLPADRRAHLHAAFAEWLERELGGRDEDASMLAHHYFEAVRPDDADLAWRDEERRVEAFRHRARTWLRRAAGLAESRYEIEEALTLVAQASELTGDKADLIELKRWAGRLSRLRYDPDGFLAAMKEALALGPEPAIEGEIYAELAEFGGGRAYMWRQPPPSAMTERWLTRALELAAPGSSARGNALLARALAKPADGAADADEAIEIGRRLQDPRLLGYALEAKTGIVTLSLDFETAWAYAQDAVEIAPRISEPEERAHLHWHAAFAALRAGRVADARRLSAAYGRLIVGLTPHHDVHDVGLEALVAGVESNWHAPASLAARAQEAATANEASPCQFNWRTLLVCALACARNGDDRAAHGLEERARESVAVGGPVELEPALLRLELLRGDLEEAERILEVLPAVGNPWDVDAPAARLDALVALGDREAVEAEAAPLLNSESLFKPFAQRALGTVRGDRRLLEDARRGFAMLGIEAG